MSIEPHASPTVEAVASLQKEAERVKPGNHVEQVKTESETLETVAAFGGLPMGDLIARPVLEASKAQQALAEGYLYLMKKAVFHSLQFHRLLHTENNRIPFFPHLFCPHVPEI